MQASRTLMISVERFDPDQDQKPYVQDYTIETSAFQGQMLLNALEAIKEQQDNSLTFRRSCGEGVCGSDGVNINGKNGLACITKLCDLPDRVVVRPLPGFPVVRDLIVDMKNFFDQYERVQPFLQNKDEQPSGEYLQSPEDRKKLDGLYECILCACCTSSCPSYWWNPKKFIGPAGLLAAYRFATDSRDTQKQERLASLKDPFSVYRCRTIMNCASSCPKGLNPTKAIGALRAEMVKDTV